MKKILNCLKKYLKSLKVDSVVQFWEKGPERMVSFAGFIFLLFNVHESGIFQHGIPVIPCHNPDKGKDL